jgi:hypothetical protein
MNRKIKEIKKERGQIIVLLALSLVTVMVVAALAVDGGMIYSERRFAQNAADSAGFAGGGTILNKNLDNKNFVCPPNSTYNSSNNIVAEAYQKAKSVALINNVTDLPFLGYIKNGTVIEDYGINDNHGVVIDCDSNSTLKNVDVIVRITSQIPTAFIHLIYPGAIQSTNEAIVTVRPGGEGALGNAIVALCPEDVCNSTNNPGIKFNDHNINVNVLNGGMFANSGISIGSEMSDCPTDDDGNYIYSECNIYAEGYINIVDDHIYGNENHIEEWITDQVIFGNDALPANFPNPDKPSCGDDDGYVTDNGMKGNKKITYYWPGNYPSDQGIKITSGETEFKPGVYCLTGDLDISGGPVTGTNVTFYIKEGSTFHMNGDASVTLVAPTESDDPNFGVLFYIEGTDNKDVLFNGNNTSYFNGMVFAPQRMITVGGSSTPLTLDEELCALIPELDEDVCEAVTFTTQFVGYQVTISGGGNIDILYNGQAADPYESSMFLNN